MSVRRLADASVQPATFAFDKKMAAEAKTWIKKYPKGREQSAVIPLLMLAQEQEGWVTKAAIEHVAEMLDMPLIRVLEVATFYTQFQLKPVGTRAHVLVCGTTPCVLRGAEQLMDVCRSKIHYEQFHTNKEGTLSWEEVECLGACVNAPMVMIFKDTYEDLTPERLAVIIDAFEMGMGDTIPVGPQTDRYFSAPASGLTTLNDNKPAKGKAKSKATSSEAATVAPSNAARPVTHADVTNPAVKSPSKVKASVAADNGASVSAPKPSAKAAKMVAGAAATANQPVSARSKNAPAAALASLEPANAKPKSAKAAEAGKAKPAKGATSWSELDEATKRATKPTSPKAIKSAPEKAAAKPAKVAKPSLDSKSRPKGIERPKAVDDLKLISGVGPKIERTLHELGIFTFAQIASWNKAEREWADGYLSFHGRIEREDWVKQAKALAKGGVAEYVRVFGKKPV